MVVLERTFCIRYLLPTSPVSLNSLWLQNEAACRVVYPYCPSFEFGPGAARRMPLRNPAPRRCEWISGGALPRLHGRLGAELNG